ncbi:MAG: VOC family protein [Nakamurella sp.]
MSIRPHDDPAPQADIEPLLDHLVYATPDLAATLTDFHKRTGVEPTAGGRHLGLGTRNYLVVLGSSSYLEIIGPDVDKPPDPGREMPFGITDLTAGRLVTWAIHPADIEMTAAASAQAGADQGPIVSMQRARPDGILLSWRLTTPTPMPMGGVVPFLIDWGSSPHPAADDVPSAGLISLRGCNPDPDAAGQVMSALHVRLPLTAQAPKLAVVLETPHGLVELS